MMMIRHGQSEFNVIYAKTRKDPGIRDPRLTELGKEQARKASDHLRPLGLTRIIASPYWRTLETAEVIAEALDLPISTNPVVGEHCAFVSDLGSPAAALRERWPHVEFGNLADEWWPNFVEEHHHVDSRARTFRDWARAVEPRHDILVVSHWGFLRALTGHEMPNCGMLRFDPVSGHPGGGDIVAPREAW